MLRKLTGHLLFVFICNCLRPFANRRGGSGHTATTSPKAEFKRRISLPYLEKKKSASPTMFHQAHRIRLLVIAGDGNPQDSQRTGCLKECSIRDFALARFRMNGTQIPPRIHSLEKMNLFNGRLDGVTAFLRNFTQGRVRPMVGRSYLSQSRRADGFYCSCALFITGVTKPSFSLFRNQKLMRSPRQP